MERISDCVYKDVCINECTAHCIRYIEIDYLLRNSNLPISQRKPVKLYPYDCDMTAFKRLATIKSNMAEWVSNGNSLYLYSTNTGNGKTSWAVKLLLKYFDLIWSGNGLRVRGIFIHTPTLLNQIKAGFNKQDTLFENLKECLPTVDLVVFDDIGSTQISQFDHSQLLSIIDNRVFSGKSCIYTGNIKPNNLATVVGDRLASRINGSECIEFKGTDRRGGR